MLLSDVWRLSVCLSRTSGLTREQRGLGRLYWHRANPRHMWLGHHFQGQNVKCQGHQAAFVGCTDMPTWTYSNGDLSICVHAGLGGGISWRPPAYSLLHVHPQTMLSFAIYCVRLSVCLSVCPQDNSKSYLRISMKLVGGVRCVTENNWLDFGSDPARDADTGILMGILQVWLGQFYEFCWKLKKLSTNSYEFLQGWDVSLAKNIRFWWYPYHDQDRGMFKLNFYHCAIGAVI